MVGQSESETLQLLVQGVTRIETKLDTLSDTTKDHEARLRWLEKKVWVMATVASVAGATAGHIDFLSLFMN